MDGDTQHADNRSQRVMALILKVVAMGMAGVSIALALIGGAGVELYGIVPGIGLFCLAVSAILDTGSL